MHQDAPSATEIARCIRAGETTAAAVMRDCLDRIASREPEIRAFAHLDPDAAMARAEAADRAGGDGPLQGVPFAIKDLIETDFAPTGWGSPIYEGHIGRHTAACVALFQAAGAVPLGKTVTTEFACFTPGPTANPAAPGHTPGGSSSGSAAAVADGMVPLAFGSQTAASLIRPAAFCGVLSYKSGLGELSLDGVMGLAQSVDSLGVLARSADDLILARGVLSGAPAAPAFADSAPRIALMRGPHWGEGSVEMRDCVSAAMARLAQAGAEVAELSTPPSFAALSEAHKTVMAFEAARARQHEFLHHRDRISDGFAALVEAGLATSHADYRGALAQRDTGLRLLAPMLLDVDAILTPAAAGPPPEGLGSTGDPLYSRSWTLLGLPAMAVPAGPGPQAVQLVGARGGDDRLLAAGAWVARVLAG